MSNWSHWIWICFTPNVSSVAKVPMKQWIYFWENIQIFSSKLFTIWVIESQSSVIARCKGRQTSKSELGTVTQKNKIVAKTEKNKNIFCHWHRLSLSMCFILCETSISISYRGFSFNLIKSVFSMEVSPKRRRQERWLWASHWLESNLKDSHWSERRSLIFTLRHCKDGRIENWERMRIVK